MKDTNKQIAIIGGGDMGKITATAIRNLLPNKNIEISIIDLEMESKIIEINSVRYKEREQPKHGHRSNRLMAMAAMLSSVSMYGMGTSNYNRQRPNVDIVKEFELIQNKKSNLCKNDRNWIEYKFNQMFVAV